MEYGHCARCGGKKKRKKRKEKKKYLKAGQTDNLTDKTATQTKRLARCTLHRIDRASGLVSSVPEWCAGVGMLFSFQLHYIRSHYLTTFFQLYVFTCSYEVGFPHGIRTLRSVRRKKKLFSSSNSSVADAKCDAPRPFRAWTAVSTCAAVQARCNATKKK